MASDCASDRRPEIPAGRTRTGWKIPKRPASIVDFEKMRSICLDRPKSRSKRRKASTSRPDRMGATPRIAADTRRRRDHQKKSTATKPQHQTIRRTLGNERIASANSVVSADVMDWPEFADTNGWLMLCTVRRTVGVLISGDQPIWRPTATRSENGIRNLTDAISQTRWRIRAWFSLRSSVSSPANPAKTVDCHKWLANGAPIVGHQG